MVTVGIVSPGAMGGALGRGWAEAGARAVATVAGRSERTRSLAHGVELLPSLADVVAVADVVVSVVPPGEAVAVARDVRAAAEVAGVAPLVADLNAVSPATVTRIAEALGPLDLVDGSISGGPPDTGTTRVYLSGPRAGDVAALGHPRLDVRLLGDALGTASAVKMSTASVYKGFSALLLHALAAADRNGVLDVVLDDLAREYPGLREDAARTVASAGAKAHRYVGEMREIAATQEAAGLPRELFEAVALVWERVAATPLGTLTPEAARARTDVAEVVRLLASDSNNPGTRVVSSSMAMTLRTDSELDHALDVLAAAEGSSKQEVIRRAVLERYERAGHAAAVRQGAERMIERWGDVLDRLGNA